MRIASLLCLTVLWFTSLSSALKAQNARDIARKVFPSVVLLVMQDANGQPMSLGSGFLVGDGVVATNVHVVRGASTGQAKLVGQTHSYPIAGLVAVDPDADLVLLKVPDTKAPALQLGEGTDLAIGDVVYAVGNPEGLEGTFSEGIVSGIRSVGSNRLLQITAPISPGSSGGPILDSRGQVVGVAVATFSEGQNLNFAIPSQYLASLLKRIAELRPLSAEKEIQGNAGTLASVLGDKNSNALVWSEFMWGFLSSGGQGFSFTLRNELASPVSDVRYLVIFVGRDGKPVDYFDGLTCPGEVILPNLGKREVKAFWEPPYWTSSTCAEMSVPDSVKELAEEVRFRVLDFRLVIPGVTDETPKGKKKKR